MVRVRIRVRAWARECTSCVFFLFFFFLISGVNIFVFGGSVSVPWITYEYSIDDNRNIDRGELSLSRVGWRRRALYTVLKQKL